MSGRRSVAVDLPCSEPARTRPTSHETRSSADADNRLDAFSGQSRSTNMVPFNSNFVFNTRRFYDIRLQKNFMTLKWGQRSLKVIESGIIR